MRQKSANGDIFNFVDSLPVNKASVVVDLMFNVLPIVCGSSVFVFILLYITLYPI